jgi:hypothetical protein
VILAVVVLVTFPVFTVKVVLCVPAGIVTLAGVVATAELLLSEIFVPEAGATPSIVTVPVEVKPLRTLVGSRVRLLTPGDVIVTFVVTAEVEPANVALTFTTVVD